MKIKIRVIPKEVTIFGSHATKVTLRNFVGFIRSQVRIKKLDVMVKTDFGCDCETKRLAQVLKNHDSFGQVFVKNRTIEAEYHGLKINPKPKTKRKAKIIQLKTRLKA